MKPSLIARVNRRVKRLQKKFAQKSLILMYHRVAEKDVDPWSLCVTPEHFAQHLEAIKKHAHPISLRELAQAHQEGKVPQGSVAITFDDGYANNLHQAKPLLERYGVPGTVFVSSGYLNSHREFWWDELDRVLLQPGRLPEKLSLNINGSAHQWELGAAVDYSEEEHQRDYARQAWAAQPGTRLFFYHSVWQLLQPLPEQHRYQAMDEILTWAEAEPVARETHRSMFPEEVHTLEQGGVVEVGAHTVNHPLLSAHSTVLQQDEIKQSKVDLEKLLGHPVKTFAYPYGAYTKETVPLVEEAGFVCACSTVEDTVWRESDRFELPRFDAINWNGKEFEQRLLSWLNS
ncbi:MAG: polysaccharide deacetylase family protein [Symploca sp. SIO1A3]|nr:polysaccharide deacetylase family protein [Symploca sp. SIO1A3]